MLINCQHKFKLCLYYRFSKELEAATLTWPAVHRDLAACDLSNIFKLVSLLMALPPTSVNNETAFSAMKLLKTKRRGRLSHSRLNDLMTVKLISEDIETFQPDAALNHWMVIICSNIICIGEK